ncbi:membrane protein YpdK [Erwinia pyri]|uniref:membrane protein YpdK n=1 Tax=Erwinia pyri TaxID=3062598 RepID=UPI003D178CC7
MRPAVSECCIEKFAKKPGVDPVSGVQRSCLVKYALMGISFIMVIWIGTFYLML